MQIHRASCICTESERSSWSGAFTFQWRGSYFDHMCWCTDSSVSVLTRSHCTHCNLSWDRSYKTSTLTCRQTYGAIVGAEPFTDVSAPLLCVWVTISEMCERIPKCVLRFASVYRYLQTCVQNHVCSHTCKCVTVCKNTDLWMLRYVCKYTHRSWMCVSILTTEKSKCRCSRSCTHRPAVSFSSLTTNFYSLDL